MVLVAIFTAVALTGPLFYSEMFTTVGILMNYLSFEQQAYFLTPLRLFLYIRQIQPFILGAFVNSVIAYIAEGF